MAAAPLVYLRNCLASSGNMWGVAVEGRCIRIYLLAVEGVAALRDKVMECQIAAVFLFAKNSLEQVARAQIPRRLGGHLPHNSRLLFHLSSLLNRVACPDSPARGVYNGVSLNAQLLCTNPPKSSKPSGCTFSMPFPICFSIPSQALPLTDATPSGNPLNQPRFSHRFPPPTSPLILDSTARELWQ